MAGEFSVGSITAKISADISNFTQGINEVKSETSSLGDKIGQTVENIRGGFEKMGLVVAAQGIIFKTLADQAIGVASNFEQTQTSFGTLLGSEQKAADLMKEIMNFEVHTPFDIQTLTNGAKAMLAFGVNAKNVVPIMSELTDMSQGQSDKLNELISIYGQVNSIQQLNGREVLRLSSIGVPIYQAIEDHFKSIGDTSMSSGEAVKNAIAKGTITAQTFNEVLQEMTSKGGLFYQENIRQMSTFAGIMSSTKSQVQYAILDLLGIDIGAANEVRKGGLFDTLRNGAAILLEWLNRLQPVFKEVGENKTFQLAIEGMVIALASLIIIIPIVIAALNPIILVVLAIEAIIVALYVAWNSNFLGIRTITTNFIAWITPFISAALTILGAAFKVFWDLITGLWQIGTAILKGNWQGAWQAIKDLVNNFWNDIKGYFENILSYVRGWGGNLVNALVQPFQDAWNRISSLMNQIKGALDFTQRHSPSVIDVIENGVSLANQAFGKLAFNNGISLSTTSFATAVSGAPINNAINIDMNGAIIADSTSATVMGEKIGDAIIGKLKLNVRF